MVALPFDGLSDYSNLC